MIQPKAFSLIELLVVLSLIAVVLSFGGRNFYSTSAELKIRVYSKQIFNVLQYARQAALLKHQNIGICPSQDGSSCVKDWQNNWIIFQDNNRNHRHDQGEQILLQLPAMKARLKFLGFPRQDVISFRASGLSNTNGSLYISMLRASQLHVAQIIISASGQLREIYSVNKVKHAL